MKAGKEGEQIDVIPALAGFYLLYVVEEDIIEEQNVLRQPIIGWRIRTERDTDEADIDPMCSWVAPIIPNSREETEYRAVQYPDGRCAYGLEFFDDTEELVQYWRDWAREKEKAKRKQMTEPS
jgi:hypothetical protein